jgi:hypothetical protein
MISCDPDEATIPAVVESGFGISTLYPHSLAPVRAGGVRKLGVPCVVDRLIQQAVLQVLPGALGPNILRAQLRLPTGAIRPPGGGPGTAIRREVY